VIEFRPVPPGEPLRISASTFVTFARCHDAAAAALRGIYGPDSRASFAGGLAHRVFARHLRGGPIDPASFQQVCREEIGASSLNHKLNGIGLGKVSTLRPLISEVQGLYERFRRFPTEGFAGAEVELEVEPLPGITLLGKVDAVFEEGSGSRLVDWKTGDLGDPLDQLLFYALLWGLSRHELPSRLEAVSLRTGERFAAVPSRAELVDLADRVVRMATELRLAFASGAALARTGGPWCRYCPLLVDCPEGSVAVLVNARSGFEPDP
jgi:hypothetical protein